MRSRPFIRASGAVLTALATLVVLAGPAPAATASSGEGSASSEATSSTTTEATANGPAPQPNIVGGARAPEGSWPSQVALFGEYRGRYGTERSFTCGGTVIDPSWVLTAAHCVTDYEAVPDEDGQFRFVVRVGSQDRERGGQLIPVARVVVRPSYSDDTLRDDVALLQLARPTDAVRPLQVASPTDIPPSGATVTTAGWGQTRTQLPSAERTLLRQVALPALSGVECRDAVNQAAAEIRTPTYDSSFLCTGPLGSGGLGPCYGDSGGPLVWETGGRKVIVGVVSWGPYCAGPEYPSVFSKVASASRWIAQTIQYGPHRDGVDFAYAVADAYFDFSVWEREGQIPPAGEPGAYVAAYHQRSVVTRQAATIVRLYDAVLGRSAEVSGYDYWRQRLLPGFFTNRAYSTTRVAEVMTRSAEFRSTYGMLSDQQFVEQVYLNVLDRAGAPSDVRYWVDRLAAGDSRGRVVLLIAESGENRARTQGSVDAQVVFLNLLGRAPVAYELEQWSTRPVAETARFVVHSVAYARRWRSSWEEG